jgi:hypothetical protein
MPIHQDQRTLPFLFRVLACSLSSHCCSCVVLKLPLIILCDSFLKYVVGRLRSREGYIHICVCAVYIMHEVSFFSNDEYFPPKKKAKNRLTKSEGGYKQNEPIRTCLGVRNIVLYCSSRSALACPPDQQRTYCTCSLLFVLPVFKTGRYATHTPNELLPVFATLTR